MKYWAHVVGFLIFNFIGFILSGNAFNANDNVFAFIGGIGYPVIVLIDILWLNHIRSAVTKDFKSKTE
jgi:hypothetical protein